MLTVGAYQAKTHLPELLDKVEAGEQITITRHRRPVARIVPADTTRSEPASAVINALRAFRKGRKLGRLSLRKMIVDGRK